MSTISVRKVQLDLANSVDGPANGEGIDIVKHDRPSARVSSVFTPARELRPYGLAKGEFIVPEDFDDPLPEDVLADFEGQRT